MVTVKERIESVLSRIEEAAGRSGRRSGDITLIAVSKTQPLDVILEAVKTGLIGHLGENRVQEGQEKIPRWPSDLPVTWHLIGHLQRNKARKALEIFDRIQSLDSSKLADTLERILQEKGTAAEILMEVNSSGEKQKSGVAMEDSYALADHILRNCPSLRLQGIMTVGPLGGEEVKIRRAFESVRELKAELSRRTGLSLPVLSMGMSGDYQWAIEEGSTMVRVGSAIFGARNYREVR